MQHASDYTAAQITKLMDEVGGVHMAAPAIVNYSGLDRTNIPGVGPGCVLYRTVTFSDGLDQSGEFTSSTVLTEDGYLWTRRATRETFLRAKPVLAHDQRGLLVYDSRVAKAMRRRPWDTSWLNKPS